MTTETLFSISIEKNYSDQTVENTRINTKNVKQAISCVKEQSDIIIKELEDDTNKLNFANLSIVISENVK